MRISGRPQGVPTDWIRSASSSSRRSTMPSWTERRPKSRSRSFDRAPALPLPPALALAIGLTLTLATGRLLDSTSCPRPPHRAQRVRPPSCQRSIRTSHRLFRTNPRVTPPDAPQGQRACSGALTACRENRRRVWCHARCVAPHRRGRMIESMALGADLLIPPDPMIEGGQQTGSPDPSTGADVDGSGDPYSRYGASSDGAGSGDPRPARGGRASHRCDVGVTPLVQAASDVPASRSARSLSVPRNRRSIRFANRLPMPIISRMARPAPGASKVQR